MSQIYPNTARRPSIPEAQYVDRKSRRNRRLLRELKRSAGYNIVETDIAAAELRVMAYYAGQQS